MRRRSCSWASPIASSDQYCLAVSYVELRTGELPLFGEDESVGGGPIAPGRQVGSLPAGSRQERKSFAGRRPPIRCSDGLPVSKWCEPFGRPWGRPCSGRPTRPRDTGRWRLHGQGIAPPTAGRLRRWPRHRLRRLPNISRRHLPIGSITETIPVGTDRSSATSKRRGPLLRRIVLRAAVVSMACGGVVAYWLSGRGRSPWRSRSAWFAKELTRVAEARFREVRSGRRSPNPGRRVEKLIANWAQCVHERAAEANFDEAAWLLRTAPEVLVGKDKH